MQKSDRPRVLLLSDSIRGKSGVGTVAHNIVLNSLDRINWIHVAPEVVNSEQLQKIDMSKVFAKLSGVIDAEVKLIPYHNFGDIELIRMLLMTEQIDSILIFTDPRYWEWLFEHEREIRQIVPIVYYNIWDNYPVPYYNQPHYESVDSLIAISKLTEDVNKTIIGKSKYKPTIEYIPHGIDENVYFPITEYTEEFLEFKRTVVGDSDFVFFWNSRNIDRKRPMDVIAAFVTFLLKYEPEGKLKLVMHTNPRDEQGTDLLKYVEHCVPNELQKSIVFSTAILPDEKINWLYNIADVTINISHNEGWGLSVTESIMAGTPVIVNLTGGMIDQINKGFGEWAYFIPSVSSSLFGSLTTPYIYLDKVNIDDVSDYLYRAYSDKKDLYTNGQHGRNWLIENGMTAKNMAVKICDNIQKTIDKFEPRTDYTIEKI